MSQAWQGGFRPFRSPYDGGFEPIFNNAPESLYHDDTNNPVVYEPA